VDFSAPWKASITICQLLDAGAIPSLVQHALLDDAEPVRRKAIYTLSSGIRNFQPGLDAVVEALPQDMKPSAKLDAGNMDAVDRLLEQVRRKSAQKGP
jgi:hsp70-interacting protein